MPTKDVVRSAHTSKNLYRAEGQRYRDASSFFFFFQAEDGIRDLIVTGFRRVLFRSSAALAQNASRSTSANGGSRPAVARSSRSYSSAGAAGARRVGVAVAIRADDSAVR